MVVLWCRTRAVPAVFAESSWSSSWRTWRPLGAGPVAYFATRPTHDILEFTDDSLWAHVRSPRFTMLSRPREPLLHWNGRTRKTVLVPDTVKDYQFCSERGWFLYRNGQNHLSLLHRETRRPRICWKTRPTVHDGPGGVQSGRHHHGISGTNRRGLMSSTSSFCGTPIPGESRGPAFGHTWNSQVAWSNVPAILFLKDKGNIQAMEISKDSSVTPAGTEAARRELVGGLQTLMNAGGWSIGDDSGASFSTE